MPLRPPLPTYGFGTPTLTDSRPATRSTVRSPHGTSTRIAAGTQVVVTGSTPIGSPSAYAGRSGASSVTVAARWTCTWGGGTCGPARACGVGGSLVGLAVVRGWRTRVRAECVSACTAVDV